MTRSNQLYEKARQLIPGGVNSPVRAFGAVDGQPFFVQSAKGAHLFDVDGRRYVDFVQSWGALILGHAHPEVVAAIQRAAERGTSYGAPTPTEVELAEQLVRWVPSLESVRLVNSGTEATMSALRLARAYTRRNKVIKFEGAYHGHADAFLVKAGSGATTFGSPSSAGVPSTAVQDTLLATYNDLASVEQLFAQHDDIAAVILEPVAGNMGVVPASRHFLTGLRELTRHHHALLIFDEVITGFRLGMSGAQGEYDIRPDLTCLGKIIGGGLPIGAFGGKREIMEQLAPLGPVYQAGTLSGNPIATAAGLTTLGLLETERVHDRLNARAEAFASEVAKELAHAGAQAKVQTKGSMFTIFFTREDVHDYPAAQQCDTAAYSRFFHALLRKGVYFPPSQFEACFVSDAHTDADLERTLRAIREALA